MATSADLLIDTSAAIAFLLPDHEAHAEVFRALEHHRLGLSGHAAFETYSVITRLPAPSRMSPRTATLVLERNFPGTRHLSTRATSRLLTRMAAADVSGGSVYDAMVGAAAAEHGLPLATRDRRALQTYAALDVDVVLLD